MAQGGSSRGKAKTAGRPTDKRGSSSSGRGSGPRNSGGSGKARSKQSAMAAQRAIKNASGRGSQFLRVGVPVLVVLVIAAVVIVGVVLTNRGKVPNNAVPANGDHSTAILADTSHDATGNAVDGIQSNDTEQVLFHIHAHLAMYVNGTQKLLPYGVGIVPPYQLQPDGNSQFVSGGSMFYWLHTHDESGVIHIESPQQRTFTLGNFFDIWGQQLSSTQVGPAKGTVTAFLNGKKYTGDPANIPLTAHAQIQLDVGKVVPFQSYTFAQGL
jgi:hypothetical protein